MSEDKNTIFICIVLLTSYFTNYRKVLLAEIGQHCQYFILDFYYYQDLAKFSAIAYDYLRYVFNSELWRFPDDQLIHHHKSICRKNQLSP